MAIDNDLHEFIFDYADGLMMLLKFGEEAGVSFDIVRGQQNGPAGKGGFDGLFR